MDKHQHVARHQEDDYPGKITVDVAKDKSQFEHSASWQPIT